MGIRCGGGGGGAGGLNRNGFRPPSDGAVRASSSAPSRTSATVIPSPAFARATAPRLDGVAWPRPLGQNAQTRLAATTTPRQLSKPMSLLRLASIVGAEVGGELKRQTERRVRLSVLNERHA